MKLLSSEELVKHDFPTPDFLVDPMIPLGGGVLVYGEPGVGKTQLLNTICATVNNGLDLFGRWPTKTGPNVVMQADMSGQIQKQRLIKSLDEINLDKTHWLTNEDGSTPIFDVLKLDLVQRKLVEHIQEIDPLAIHWDTLRRIHTLPENASETVTKVINAAKKIAKLATQFYYHHTRKKSRDPDSPDLPEEDFLGHQHWRSTMDAMIYLEIVDPTASPVRLRIVFTKARTAPPWEKNESIFVETDPRTMLLLPCKTYDSSDPHRAVAELRATRDEALFLQG